MSSPLKEGTKLPDFAALASSGKTIKTQDLLGKSFILYFYPRDNTPGCTQESCDFAQSHPEFEKMDIAVFGISRDSLKSHENFKQKYHLPFELISDSDEELCVLFDVLKTKNMYGKKVKGIERSTFLIDSQGVIQKIWRNVTVENHVKEVLNELKKLQSV